MCAIAVIILENNPAIIKGAVAVRICCSEFVLAQIVTLVFARAASLRAIWKAEWRSLAVLVMRLFAVNSLKFGIPKPRTTPTIRTVIINSYSVKPFSCLVFMRAIYSAACSPDQVSDEWHIAADERSILRSVI